MTRRAWARDFLQVSTTFPSRGRPRVPERRGRLAVLRAFKAVDDDADSVDGVTADSAKLHLRALEILKNEGKEDNYSADEYMLAVEQAQGAAA
jgi:hypothetical protein